MLHNRIIIIIKVLFIYFYINNYNDIIHFVLSNTFVIDGKRIKHLIMNKNINKCK